VQRPVGARGPVPGVAFPGPTMARVATTETLVRGGDRIRIGPWRGRADVAAIVPYATRRQIRTDLLNESIASAQARGYRSAVTAALSPAEMEPFQNLGFTVDHELHLLVHPLSDLTAPSRVRLRRATARDWDRVISIDQQAFNEFWRFDRSSIEDALRATPSRRFRMVRGKPSPGYHISGRAGETGYLQRLAVDPSQQGTGLGSLLLADSLTWMRDKGARSAWVNTQVGNEGAVRLYTRHGFRLADYRLSVLTRTFSANPGGVAPSAQQQLPGQMPHEVKGRLAHPPTVRDP